MSVILPVMENLSQIPQIIAEYYISFLCFQRNLRETYLIFFHFIKTGINADYQKINYPGQISIKIG